MNTRLCVDSQEYADFLGLSPHGGTSSNKGIRRHVQVVKLHLVFLVLTYLYVNGPGFPIYGQALIFKRQCYSHQIFPVNKSATCASCDGQPPAKFCANDVVDIQGGVRCLFWGMIFPTDHSRWSQYKSPCCSFMTSFCPLLPGSFPNTRSTAFQLPFPFFYHHHVPFSHAPY